MGIMKRPEKKNICQKICSSSGKLQQCNAQDVIDSISFDLSMVSTEISLEAGVGSTAETFSNDGIDAKVGICSDAGTGPDAGIRGIILREIPRKLCIL
jgi:hypothetical protein